MKRSDGQEKDKMKEQDEWIARLNSNGHYACYAYGWVHAVEILTAYLNNKL